MVPPPPPLTARTLTGLVLAYGAATLAGQVLILREVLVLAQGQELKLALGLWCWLFWTGLGSLLGGRWAEGRAPGSGILAGLLAGLALLLPGTLFLARALPTLASGAVGQSLPPASALLLFLGLLAPFCLVSGVFFPVAAAVQRSLAPAGALGRIYYLESLGAALGVCLVQLILMGRVPSLTLALGMGLCLLVTAWVLAPSRPGAGLALGSSLLILGIGLALSSPLENFSRRLQWPGRDITAVAESPYALLTATREAEQQSFFANRTWHFTHPDPFSAEMAVHPGLLQHPRPRTVLLLGGGAGGLIPEVLKNPGISRVDYVELDPDLVRLVRACLPEAAALPLRDPRVRLIYEDARRFLAQTPERYDVILMNLPEPASAQLNRYYTREFFTIAARALTPGGVFSFTLPGGETSLNPLRAASLALAYHTLGRVFPEVLVLPGERLRFAAGLTPGDLTADPEALTGRLAARGLELRYVREYYLLSDLAPDRREYVHRLLVRQPPEINTDLNPRSYFYDLALTGAREGLPTKDILLFLKGLPPAWPWGFLCLGLTLCLVLGRRPGPRYLLQVFIMGLGAMTLEITILILCQIHLGYLYRQLGLLIAAFMGGMGMGGAWGVRLASRSRALAPWVAACQGALALLALSLALLLPALSASPRLPPEALLQVGYLLVLFTAGFAGGGVFSLASSLWTRDRPASAWRDGLFYAADLLGATLGSLGLSLVVLPVWGLAPALYVVAVLHLGAALRLWR